VRVLTPTRGDCPDLRVVTKLWLLGRVLLVGGCIFVCGCDPGIVISGLIVTSDGTPVASAEVRLDCPDPMGEMDAPSATSDIGGRYELTGMGCLANDCVISLSLADGGTASGVVRDHCVSTDFLCRGSCSAARANFLVSTK
jgi:hypothetical protein